MYIYISININRVLIVRIYSRLFVRFWLLIENLCYYLSLMYFMKYCSGKYDLLHLVARHGGRELMETVIKEYLEDLKSDTTNVDNYNILNSAVEADNGETVSIILGYITKMKSEAKSIGKNDVRFNLDNLFTNLLMN